MEDGSDRNFGPLNNLFTVSEILDGRIFCTYLEEPWDFFNAFLLQISEI